MVSVTERKSKKGKTVWRIKKLYSRECLWTDDQSKIEELKERIKSFS